MTRAEIQIYVSTIGVLFFTAAYWRRYRRWKRPSRTETSMMKTLWFASIVLAIIAFLFLAGIVYK